MNRLKGFLLHIGVICSFVCIAAKVLDWYNPYMDFAGHIWFVQPALYFVVVLLALLKNPQKELLLLKESGRHRRSKRQKRQKKQ